MSTEVRVSYVWTLGEIRRATEVWRRASNVVIVSDWWGLILIYGILVAYAAWRVRLSNDLSEQRGRGIDWWRLREQWLRREQQQSANNTSP